MWLACFEPFREFRNLGPGEVGTRKLDAGDFLARDFFAGNVFVGSELHGLRNLRPGELGIRKLDVCNFIIGKVSVENPTVEFELRQFRNLRLGELDAGDFFAGKVFVKFGTFGSDDGALGLGLARAIGVGGVDVEVGSAVIAQSSSNGGTDGSSYAAP